MPEITVIDIRKYLSSQGLTPSQWTREVFRKARLDLHARVAEWKAHTVTITVADEFANYPEGKMPVPPDFPPGMIQPEDLPWDTEPELYVSEHPLPYDKLKRKRLAKLKAKRKGK